MNPKLQFTQNLIKKAGQLIVEMQKEAKASYKSAKDVVTEADLASEKLIVEAIKKEHPNDHIISEENYSDFELTNERFWVIDPIDGTVNYSRGTPLYGISIALIENKELILGVIYLPKLNELYWAEKGTGAFCNNEPIHVSGIDELNKSIVSGEDFNCGQKENLNNQRQLQQLTNLANETMRVHIVGSAVVGATFVASGKVEGKISSGFFWDIAAAKIIVEEAGGKVTKKDGSPYDPKKRDTVLSNGRIHQELLDVLA